MHTTPALRPGLCSVTLRALPTREVIDIAARAGLSAIEWGADVHVPVGDPTTAAAVGRATIDAGLAVASYGTYYRVGDHGDFAPVLEAATALGAPRIRVWAGRSAPDAATDHERRAVVEDARRIGALAREAGVRVSFESHEGTLTQRAGDALRLLEEVAEPAVTTYWQPPNRLPDGEVLDDLAIAVPHVDALHVFSWWPYVERHPLDHRAELWTTALRALAARGRATDVLLEFVLGHEPEQLVADAQTLQRYIEAAASTTPTTVRQGQPT